jgi:hypothetical protein
VRGKWRESKKDRKLNSEPLAWQVCSACTHIEERTSGVCINEQQQQQQEARLVVLRQLEGVPLVAVICGFIFKF